jgi:hypothetical protein
MKDVSIAPPDFRVHRIDYPSGAQTVHDEPSASFYALRTSSGYTGKRVISDPLPNNMYSLNVQDIDLDQVLANYYYYDGRHEWARGPVLNRIIGGATYLPAYSGFSNLVERAKYDLSENLRGNLDVSIDLIQARQTAKMTDAVGMTTDLVRQSVDHVTKVYGKGRGSKLKTFELNPKGFLRSLGSGYLIYQYGIRPALSTIYGSIEEATNIVINKMRHVTGRASESYYPTSVSLQTIWGPLSFPLKSTTLKQSVTFCVNMWSDDGWNADRWSSLNPASIAWEALPFSFVADWFVNVGGYLRALETFCRYRGKFVSGYRTALSVGHSYIDWRTGGQNDSVAKLWESQYRGFVKHVDIQRVAISSYPSPAAPVLDVRLGSSRLLSSASLIAQLLKR